MQLFRNPSLILLCAIIKNSTSNLDATNNKTMEKCAAKVVETVKTHCMIIISDSNSDLVYNLLILETGHIFVSTKSNLQLGNLECTPTSYVIVLADFYNYEGILKGFYGSQLWNPRAKFFVIHNGTGKVRDLFKVSWEYFLLNLIILDQSRKIYSYSPFENGACGNYHSYREVYNCDINLYPTMHLLFRGKLPKVFNGCPVRVLPIKVEPHVIDIKSTTPGIEISLLKEIAIRSNLSLILIENNFTDWGHKFPDGTYSLMYHELSKKNTDVVVGMVVTNASFYYDFDGTVVYNQDLVTFFVPTAQMIDGWRNFIHVFDNGVWASTCVTLLVVPLSWWILGKTIKGPHALGSLVDCIFRTFEILFTAYGVRFKKTLLRYLFWTWCVTCLILSSAYQTKLISFLTKPAYEHQMTTFAEMVDSQLPYGGFPLLKSLMNESGNEVFLKVFRNWISCPLTIECVNRTAEKRDFAVFKSTKIINYLMPRLYTYPDGRKKLYKLKDVITVYQIHMRMIRGLPYYETFNQLILKIVENGLFSKWSADLESAKKYKVFNEFKQLSVGHLKIIFMVYMIGNFLAFITFLLEICLHRYFRKPLAFYN